MLVEVGKIVEGKVSGITKFGAFVQLPEGKTGLVHISEIALEYVNDIKEHLKDSQLVKVKIISIDNNGKISLSIKKTLLNKEQKLSRPAEIDLSKNNKNEKASFEDLLAKFKKDSDEKFHDLKKNFESKRGSGYRKSIQF